MIYIHNPKVILRIMLNYISPLIKNDESFIKILWKINMNYPLNLESPTTFSEKMQWLKLYNHHTEFTMMVDKVKVKDYVASILGVEFIIPTLGVWEDPDMIDFDSLPEKFVIKCNHNSGTGMYICKDKSKMNINEVKDNLRAGLKENYYLKNREWPYKNVPRKIIAEKYIEPAPDTNDLPDYKFFCFNGEPKYCQVITGRESKMCIDFFDKEWNHQPFHEPKAYPFAEFKPKRPKQLEKMWNAAAKLAEGHPFSRIDFYEVGDDVYFGEITLFPTSGMGGFSPAEYDLIFGKLINLPIKKLEI